MRVFVIHPKHLKERELHINRMLHRIGLDYEFMNEGESEEKVQEYFEKYLKDGEEKMLQRVPRSLCTISHFLVYEKIVSEKLDGALVLEDDAVLYSNFLPLFRQTMVEYRNFYSQQRCIISYEDSSLQFIPRSQREEGRMLYPGKKDRTAGVYYINNVAATAILSRLQYDRCDVAIDLYHNKLLKDGFITYLWCQPALATQGSFTGAFRSSLSKKKDIMIKLRWQFKRNYKRLLYWLR